MNPPSHPSVMFTIVRDDSPLQLQRCFGFYNSDLQSYVPWSYVTGMRRLRPAEWISFETGVRRTTLGQRAWHWQPHVWLRLVTITHREVRCGNSKQPRQWNAQSSEKKKAIQRHSSQQQTSVRAQRSFLFSKQAVSPTGYFPFLFCLWIPTWGHFSLFFSQ